MIIGLQQGLLWTHACTNTVVINVFHDIPKPEGFDSFQCQLEVLMGILVLRSTLYTVFSSVITQGSKAPLLRQAFIHGLQPK